MTAGFSAMIYRRQVQCHRRYTPQRIIDSFTTWLQADVVHKRPDEHRDAQLVFITETRDQTGSSNAQSRGCIQQSNVRHLYILPR